MSRILIVEDDHAVSTSLRRVLEGDGHAVIEARDGESALQEFYDRPADVVISDVYMPDMDGIEFMMRIRETFPDARIVIMSGGGHISREDVLAVASRLGADRVFEKPFEMEQILDEVRSLLAQGPPL